jgi:hypothetical protein
VDDRLAAILTKRTHLRERLVRICQEIADANVEPMSCFSRAEWWAMITYISAFDAGSVAIAGDIEGARIAAVHRMERLGGGAAR